MVFLQKSVNPNYITAPDDLCTSFPSNPKARQSSQLKKMQNFQKNLLIRFMDTLNSKLKMDGMRYNVVIQKALLSLLSQKQGRQT